MGLYSMGEEAYLRNISKFCLFTRVRGMSENMEGAKKLYIHVFLVGVTVVGAVRRFWILVLKTIFIDF